MYKSAYFDENEPSLGANPAELKWIEEFFQADEVIYNQPVNVACSFEVIFPVLVFGDKRLRREVKCSNVVSCQHSAQLISDVVAPWTGAERFDDQIYYAAWFWWTELVKRSIAHHGVSIRDRRRSETGEKGECQKQG
jgi:hypothetical protein